LDGNIKLVSLHNPEQFRIIRSAHTGAVKTVAFDPAREYLASAGLDGWLKIWKYVADDKLEGSLEILSLAAIEYG